MLHQFEVTINNRYMNKSNKKLDVNPRRDDDASPISYYRCMLMLEWYHLFGTSQNISQNSILNLKRKQVKQNASRNSISNFFWKKKRIFMFPCCSTLEDHSTDVSITNAGLILTKLWWFLFSGYGQTDTVLESSYGNMSAHKKFQLKAQN